ncbi:helix-turn-helix transcriptional regulator [Sphingomonas sp. LY160]|uniref:helix-turn-helix transcriptional regulator n=1 Tax=Sphingomonas sp. LY160 TaxID=3095342 RepID=UPI002ADEDBFC|nr:LuxR C-terminal-related transcriptional regulator [Sphingomonas sp. LY160]MEA1073284.1 LuxR C-terminal-related transcriptional regulator [Sphingomonas sp. LY160]
MNAFPTGPSYRFRGVAEHGGNHRGPEHRIQFANAALRKAFGETEYQNRPAAEVVELGAERQEIQDYLDSVFRSGTQLVRYAVPMAGRSASGGSLTHAYYDALYHPLIDSDGRTIGVFVEGHDVTRTIANGERRPASGSAEAIPELSNRQREVLSCLIGGLNGKQIANALGISIRTVDLHRTSLLRRLGVKTTTQLIGVIARRPEIAALAIKSAGQTAHESSFGS